MASNLLKMLDKIERGRQKCISKANEVGYPLSKNASLEQIANCIDAQGYVSEYYDDYKALITKDYSNLEDKKIRLPYDIESIGAKAFYGDTNLTGVIFPGNLKSIGQSAFEGCTSWEGVIDIPNTVETIGNNAFYNTGYKSGSLQTGVNIPSSVKSIGQTAFRGVRGIINFDANVDALPYGFLQNSSTATGGDATFVTEFNISEERLNKITSIGTYAFSYQRYLKKIPIGPNLVTLGANSFEYCESIENHITIPSCCKSIGATAFQYAKLLGGITLEEGVESIGNGAFKLCQLTIDELHLPKTVKSIEQDAFYGTYNKYSIINGTNTKIELKRLIVPYEETLSLGYGAFEYCDAEEIILHCKKMTYTNSNGRQWYYSDTKNVVFINLQGDTSLNTSAFQNCKITEGGIYIPDDLVDVYKAKTGWTNFKSYIKPLSSWSGYAEYMAGLNQE